MDSMDQYKTAERLNTRISLHEKYSVNKQGFSNWIVSQYEDLSGKHVLELGCGTAVGWKNHPEILASCGTFTASDLSAGMLEEARCNLPDLPHLALQQINIEEIPFEDGSLDAVFAHMMLYHVRDLEKALGEVCRVLKPGGAFYCATYGKNGILLFLEELLKEFGVRGSLNRNFTLDNGGEYLSRFFETVEKREYPDALAITDVEDMADYFYSCGSLQEKEGVPREELCRLLEERKQDGILKVPKEYGMFVCRKSESSAQR